VCGELRGVDGGDISNAGTYRLGLNVETALLPPRKIKIKILMTRLRDRRATMHNLTIAAR
jgi:hypothetical protein